MIFVLVIVLFAIIKFLGKKGKDKKISYSVTSKIWKNRLNNISTQSSSSLRHLNNELSNMFKLKNEKINIISKSQNNANSPIE